MKNKALPQEELDEEEFDEDSLFDLEEGVDDEI